MPRRNLLIQEQRRCFYKNEEALLTEATHQERLETLYQEGVRAAGMEAWLDAIKCFEAVIAEDVFYKDAVRRYEEACRQIQLKSLYILGQGYEQKNDWEQAIVKYEALHKLDQDYKDVAALLEKARTQLRLQTLYFEATEQFEVKQWREAIKKLELIVQIDRTYKDSHTKLAQAQKKDRLQTLDKQAQAHFDAERWIQAIRDWGTILGEAPDYPGVEKKLEEAKKWNEIAALYSTAIGLQEMGKDDEAIDKFTEIIRRVRVYKDVADRLAKVQRRHEKRRRREEYGSGFCKLVTRNMDTRTKPQKTKRQLVELYDKAMKHLQKKKLRKAKITFGKIMDIDPNYRDVATQLKNIQASSNNKFFDFLRDPLWQGIGGVVAIAAFVITVYTLLQGTSNPAATPTPATTALPTNTPTVSPVPPTETPSVIPYPTPVLISPDEGKLFTEEENVKLEWEWDQDLATNEFFEARIRLKGDLEFDALVPTKLSQDIVPASKLTQSGTYEWQVAIVLLTGEEKSVSPIRSFEMR